FFDLVSTGRAGPPERFTPQQIAHISRTVRRAPEVMVKVTGGARKLSAALAHMAYISQRSEVDLVSDDGRIIAREDQKAFLTEWHLELSSGQYRRPPRDGRPCASHQARSQHRAVDALAYVGREGPGGCEAVCAGEVWRDASLRDGAAHPPGT